MDEKNKKKKLKKLPPIYRPIPPEKQMYPHTHYDKELNLQWVFEVMGILRSWDKSLTHLMLKLADLHNKDIDEIIKEIQKLIDLLQSWIKALETALNDYANAENLYTQQTILEAQALTILTETIYTGINDLTPIFEALFDCIENTLKKHDSYFEDILDSINNIYVDLQSIHDEINQINEYINEIFDILTRILSNTETLKTLTYRTDYNVTWYNGFTWGEGYSASLCPYVRESLTALSAPGKTYYSDVIRIVSNTSHYMTNTNTIVPDVESAPLFAHGNGYVNVPESRIMRITWLNTLKNYTFGSFQQTGNDIFNMLPYRARASWGVTLSADNYSTGNVMIYEASIADGYNRQYYTRYDYELTFALLNFTIILNYSYSS